MMANEGERHKNNCEGACSGGWPVFPPSPPRADFLTRSRLGYTFREASSIFNLPLETHKNMRQMHANVASGELFGCNLRAQ